MDKTRKKAAPGGDERNLNVRRQKATTAASKASETSLTERLRESDNRAKISGMPKKIPIPERLEVKKAGALKQVGISRPRSGRPPLYQKHRKSSALLIKSTKEKVANMQSEVEEAEVKLKVSMQKENNEDSTVNKDESETTNNKESAEHTLKENAPVPEKEAESKPEKQQQIEPEQEKPHVEKNGTSHNNENQTRETEEGEENDMKLSFDVDDSPVKSSEERLNQKEVEPEEKPEEVHSVHEEIKNGSCEKDDLPSEPQTDTESCSVDVVESTTSELSEASESLSQADSQKELPKDATESDISFVTYDSSIMLKDVQIKLNDCLKENSKVFEDSKEESSILRPPNTELSFGKTLRNISARPSLSRMRHVTIREQRLSPNNSLFVNTSNISLQPDDMSDFKILRCNSGLSDTFSKNGTPVDRKRKSESENWTTTKKQKREPENSFLSASMNLFRGFRRPVQVSTPNLESFKLQSTKLDLSGMESEDDEPKIVTGQADGARKWCVLM